MDVRWLYTCFFKCYPNGCPQVEQEMTIMSVSKDLTCVIRKFLLKSVCNVIAYFIAVSAYGGTNGADHIGRTASIAG